MQTKIYELELCAGVTVLGREVRLRLVDREPPTLAHVRLLVEMAEALTGSTTSPVLALYLYEKELKGEGNEV